MRHNQRSLVPQHDPNKGKANQLIYINKNAALLNGWLKEGDSANVFLSLRFVQHQFQCFSEWDKNEMKSFWAFSEKLHDMTWEQILQQATKGRDKSGMAYTIISKNNYPKSEFSKTIDPHSNIFELRVTQKARVHCFRDKSICYVCWLDKNHQICP